MNIESFLKKVSTKNIREVIEVEKCLKGLDLSKWNRLYWEAQEGFESTLRDRDNSEDIGGAKKYFQLRRYLRLNVRRYFSLKLPKETVIVDLGCGAGYFVYVSICKGHRAVGLDRPTSNDFDREGPPVFQKMTDFFEIPKIHHQIEPMKPLPKMVQHVDLFTGFNAWFDGRYGENRSYIPWGEDEWSFFLSDLKTRLTKNGRIFMELNEKWEYKVGFYHHSGLVDIAKKLGFRVVSANKGIIDLRI